MRNWKKHTKPNSKPQDVSKEENIEAWKRPLTHLVWYDPITDGIFTALYLDRNHFFYCSEMKDGRLECLGEL